MSSPSSTGGNGNGRPSLKLTLPNLGAIVSVVTLLSFVMGGYIGYTAFKADMLVLTNADTVMQGKVEQMRVDIAVIGRSLSDDKQTLSTRLTIVEKDIEFIKQGIAQLQLRATPAR